MSKRHPDAILIDALGGPTAVAKLLGFDPAGGGVQRVTNWKSRGIPAAVRLEHRSVFERKSLTRGKAA